MGQRRTRNLQDLICGIRVACAWINVPAGVQVIVLCQRRSLSGGMDVRWMHQGGFESQNECRFLAAPGGRPPSDEPGRPR